MTLHTTLRHHMAVAVMAATAAFAPAAWADKASAIDEMEAAGGCAQRKRTVQREGVAGPAAILLRRNYGDFRVGLYDLGQQRKARGLVSVIVAEKNAHDGD